MIILASNFVGLKAVDFLIHSKEKIDFLVLDQSDKGGYNKKIISLFKTAYKEKEIHYNNTLSNDQFLALLKNLKPSLGILAWWPYILKGKILSIPKNGWLNFHPSYLPFNRGKYPNFWCLVDETKCGVSLHFIDEGIDTGDIVVRREIESNWEDTGQTIYEKSIAEIISLFSDNFNNIKDNRLNRIKQSPKDGTYHKPSEMNDICQIDLNKNYTGRKLLNILRAKIFPPHSPAFFYHDGKKYSVEIRIKEIKNE